jgi:hypothetical protein
MTVNARKVLRDLEAAHELLEVEEDTLRFRILWVASVALCRAVGHVLQKVDSSTSVRLSSVIQCKYSSWKAQPDKHRIFFDFVEDERNSVLKEYEFGFMSGPIDVLILPDGVCDALSDNLFCPLSGGAFVGEDARDVLAVAIRWWQTQLSEIDDAVASGLIP